MKKLLITGGTGFFGKSILNYLDNNDGKFDITIISRNGIDISRYKNLSIAQIKSDIRSIKLHDRYDYVIHAATPAIVNISDDNMYSIIVDGMNNLINQIKEASPMSKILFTSSGAVYGDYDRLVSENDRCHPKTTYGKAKLEAEEILLKSGLKCNIARCFAFSGKNLKQDIHFAIGNFIKNARENSDIIIKSDGNSIRSYLDQFDLSNWLIKILLNGKNNEIYNVGSDQIITIKNLAIKIQKRFNPNINIRILGNKNFSNNKDFYAPSIDKIKKELNCYQTISLDDSLSEMYNISYNDV